MTSHVCRVLIETEANPGSWNMAVDEALLESAANGDDCWLRWYRWSVATLSLGYFQPAEAASTVAHWNGLPVVRRLSGGGAILHHHEWTYSCAVPSVHRFSRVPPELYGKIHERMIAVLFSKGIDAQRRGISSEEQHEPFLCFGRGDSQDIVYRGHKILGSAQRRRRGAVIQHGSLLLRQSEYADEFPGLLDLVDVPLGDSGLSEDSLDSLIEELAREISSVFGKIVFEDRLPASIYRRAVELETEKYSSLNWNRRRRRKPLSNPSPLDG